MVCLKEFSMEFIEKDVIKVDRELSDLDLFTLDFVKILKKYFKYVIISGYVAIVFGRARGSEDVDIIVGFIDFSKFEEFLSEIKKSDFYCINSDDSSEIYDYAKETAARFAKEGTVIPNIELKFARKEPDFIALDKVIKIKLGSEEILTSCLELQIAFKEVVLKSPKDMEDAKHLRNVFKDNLDFSLIKKYEVMLNGI